MSLTKILAMRVSNYDSQTSLGSKLRARRILPLLDMIQAVFREKGAVKLIDLGGMKRYWNIVPAGFLAEHRVNITIVNLPGRVPAANDETFTFVEADACDLRQFADMSFDIAHSNSVLEHVGDWGRMVNFAREVRRMAARYFVQTPNYWFPVEPHCMTLFFHWLPKPTRIWLVSHFALGNWRKAASTDEAVRIVESARLVNRKMLQQLFPDARILTERFMLLPKSFVAIRE